MRKDKLLIFVCSLLFFSCATDDYISNDTLLSQKVENKAGALLMHQIQTQKGNKEQFVRALNGHTPLFNYVTVSSSGDYGLYYSVPYTNSDNEVEGCIIYPVDTNLSMEQRRIGGTLGTLVNMDPDFLNGEVDLSTRYLYSAAFLNWQNNGLSVNSGLTAHAELLNAGPVIANTRGLLSRAGTGTDVYGKNAFVSIQYSLSSTGYVSGGNFGVTTLKPATVKRLFDGYLLPTSPYCRDAITHSIETNNLWGIRIFIAFSHEHNGAYVLELIYNIINEIVWATYGQRNIYFRAESINVTFSDGRTGSYYGGGSGSTGGPSGGSSNGIYKKCSIADILVRDSVIRFMNTVIKERCAYQVMKNSLANAGRGFSDIKIQRDKNNYDPQTGVYTVSSAGYTSGSFPEEYVHLFQNFTYSGGIYQYAEKKGNANIDFEAKFINDITSYLIAEPRCWYYGAGVSYEVYYKEWISQLAEKAQKGKLTYEDITAGYYCPDTNKPISYSQFMRDWSSKWDSSPLKNKYGTKFISPTLQPKVLQVIVGSISCKN